MQKGQSSLFIGGLYALTTAALLATQAPLSFLAAKQLSVAVFIGVTELVLLLCVPFKTAQRQPRGQITTTTTPPEFFSKRTLAKLRTWTDKDLGDNGRLTQIFKAGPK